MKILASDFDKTFFSKDYLTNIKKVNKFVNDGNIFIIVTGRNFTHLKKDIKGFNINYNYLICNDGGIVFDKDDKVLYRKDINPSLVKPILDILKNDNNIRVATIDNSRIYVDDPSQPANAILGKPYDMEKGNALLINIMTEFPGVHGYTSDNWINITDKSVSKASGLQYIQKMLGISTNNIFTVGDNINDVPMNELYNGYAMKDSIPELIEVSKGIVTSVAELIDLLNEDNNN